MNASRVNRDKLTGFNLTDEARTTQVQGRSFGSEDPARVEAPEYQRTIPVRVARPIQRVLIHENQGESALQTGQDFQCRGDEGGRFGFNTD